MRLGLVVLPISFTNNDSAKFPGGGAGKFISNFSLTAWIKLSGFLPILSTLPIKHFPENC